MDTEYILPKAKKTRLGYTKPHEIQPSNLDSIQEQNLLVQQSFDQSRLGQVQLNQNLTDQGVTSRLGQIFPPIETSSDLIERLQTPISHSNPQQTETPIVISILEQYNVDNDYNLMLARLQSCLNANSSSRLVNEVDSNGRTPLMHSKLTVVSQLLIEKGANVNSRDNLGRTALMYAENAKIAQILINSRADLNFRDYEDRTALIHAINRQPNEYNKTVTSFLKANDRMELIRLLIRSVTRQNINLEDKQKRNAILSSVMLNDVETTRVLIAKGADVDSTDNDGMSAVMLAVNKTNIEMLRLLIDNKV